MLQINQVLESWLNRGFKGPKCKTLLKLASSRIKLLRNKRLIQVKQLRKETAQLLQNGQDNTALIRVEQVIREQSLMEAYDTLELFCELMIVRMPLIEAQSECPLDLKEAISSLIFAAPRLSDVPELLEVQNMLSFKYGKEFVAAAVELRPECHVNRLVIEKLSAEAPDIQMKLSLMKEIANENNVEWDSTNVQQEYSDLPKDVLNLSNHFPQHTKDDSSVNTSTSRHKDGQSNFVERIQMLPIPYMDDEEQPKARCKDQPVNKHVEPEHETHPSRFYSPPRESSITKKSDLFEETLLERTHSRTKSEGSINLQDIIDAAEAAADSAEKAARAARAAAELARLRISSKPPNGISDDKALPQVSPNMTKGIDSAEKAAKAAMAAAEFARSSISETSKSLLEPGGYDWDQFYHKYKPTGKETHDDKSLSQPLPNTTDNFQPVAKASEDAKFSMNERTRLHLDPDSYDWDQVYNDNKRSDEGPILNEFSAKKDAHENVFVESLPVFDDAVLDQQRDVFHAYGSESSHLDSLHRYPSLEDDPYYTYPNLFTKP